MPTNAPNPNCGFTTTGSPGWVRLWLVNDNINGPGADLWAIPGKFYPLQVCAYEFINPQPASIAFDERDDLGGYTRSRGLDESPYDDLEDNVGVYACGNATFDIATTNELLHEVTLTGGDFYAGNVVEVGIAPYLFLVIE